MKTILVDAVDCLIVDQGSGFGIYKEMYELLESFPHRKIILTNADYDKYETYGLDKAPYEVFTLKHNPEKTDPEYFKIMLEHYNLSANDVVYFEHNLEAVKSAESVGIKAYHYDQNKKDLVALRNFLAGNL